MDDQHPIFDGDVVGIHGRVVGLNRHLITLDADRMRIVDRPAGCDIELPAMPGTAQDLAVAGPDILTRFARQGHALDRPKAERCCLVRAAVAQRKEAAVHVEDADRASFELDDLALARPELAGPTYHMLAHP